MNDVQPPTAYVDAESLLNSTVRDLRRGALVEARQMLGKAVEMYRQADDSTGLAMALYNLGVVEFRSALHDDAAGHFSAAVEVFGRSEWSPDATLASAGRMESSSPARLSTGDHNSAPGSET